jgi:threonylcarbamoyladenosine tRNA methylthiotransferase MtaB
VPAEEVVREINDRAGRGYQEVILTGARIGAYDGAGGLAGLMRRILDDTAIPRLRLSSLQPGEVPRSLIDLWGEDGRICCHLHLALQSGSDSVLKRMGRRYCTSEYEETVNLVREAMPDIAITTDVIVGFPGESAEEFEESYRFCERIGFAGLHIFPYSARPATPAARMPDKVPDKIKKARSRIMIDLAHRSARNFRRRFSGRTMPVLWEERKGEYLWIGHTGNYIKVITRSDEPLRGYLIETKLSGEYEDALWGDISRIGSSAKEGEER